MFARHLRTLIVVTGVFVMSSLISISAVLATPRPSACGADCISGLQTGGGTHFTGGNAGAGSRAGYGAVRFDGFTPDPTYSQCSNPATYLYSSLGIPSGTPGPYYVHYRTPVSRFDTGAPLNLVANKSVVGGVDGNVLLSGPYDFNADTGALRPSSGSSEGPTQSNPWITPYYRDAPKCLPLSGGGSFEEMLRAARPVITFKPGVKGLVGMKKSTVHIEIDERSLYRNNINLNFQLKNIVALVCDEDINEKPENEGTFVGCYSGTDKKSPVYFKTTNIEWESKDANTKMADVKIKFRKKGNYHIVVGAAYSGNVAVNGEPVSATAVTTYSDETLPTSHISVRSSKSVSRK